MENISSFAALTTPRLLCVRHLDLECDPDHNSPGFRFQSEKRIKRENPYLVR